MWAAQVCNSEVLLLLLLLVMSDPAIPWTIACQAPLSMEFSSQEYQSG